jgi:hypothetical protein
MSEENTSIEEVDWERAKSNLHPEIYQYLFSLYTEFKICPNLDYWEEQNIQNPTFEEATDLPSPENK